MPFSASKVLLSFIFGFRYLSSFQLYRPFGKLEFSTNIRHLRAFSRALEIKISFVFNMYSRLLHEK